jgi:hypothetical protein
MAGVQVVAREPGHVGYAAVIHGSDGFPLALDEVEQEVKSLIREHGERSVKPEDGTSGRDPVREVRQGRAVGRRHRTDQRACASHGLLLGCGDYAVTLLASLRAGALRSLVLRTVRGVFNRSSPRQEADIGSDQVKQSRLMTT